MTHDPNPEQQRLIESLDGVFLVDAGAGTGKTFTITRRYAHILDETDAEPGDILLTTFTENAAETMKERILTECSYDRAALREAPIATFHGFCNEVLQEHGFAAPRELGIDDRVTSSVQVIENSFLEEREFERFMQTFVDDHPEYVDLYRIVSDWSDLLELVTSLASKGIFPTADGWYRGTEAYLEGSLEAFWSVFSEANQPRNGGSKQSKLRERLGRYGKKLLTDDAPSHEEVRGSRGTKQVEGALAERAFREDRSELLAFIHDVYHGYIEYALANNFLNFQFMMMLAYVLLVEDDALREELSFDYVMLDEFQDTNEIQFKLALLLSSTGNIAAVGDWKQSIFGFKYAAVENITEFEDRLERYRDELNDTTERVNVPDDVERIALTRNYRSSQRILDLSEVCFELEATGSEELDPAVDITSLEADREDVGTRIEAFRSEDELEAVLEKIEEIVGSEEYMVDDGTPGYGDIAVLTRSRDAGIELQELADRYGIPVSFEGGVELFTTDPALLLLAWLRILGWGDEERGWVIVLEDAGYTIEEIDCILEEDTYPEEMLAFRDELEGTARPATLARKVFDRYGLDNGFTTTLLSVLCETFDATLMDMGGLVRFIEANIENGTTYDVDTSEVQDAVTVQTIHSAKGLEYPVVFVADMNTGSFPSTQSGSCSITYRDPVGLRQRKQYNDEEMPYVYDNWRAQVLLSALAGEYDEERRLLYVAMTRAQDHLLFSAEAGREGRFFEGLPLEKKHSEPSLEERESTREEMRRMRYDPVERPSPVKLSAHAVVDALDETEGRGIGTELHRFAEAYADGGSAEAGHADDFAYVANMIDGLEGDLRPEQTVLLPLEDAGRRFVLEGVIDLLHVLPDRVEVLDYKTHRDREREEAFRRQLSVYYYVMQEVFPDREVVLRLVYTGLGETVELDPVPRQELVEELQG